MCLIKELQEAIICIFLSDLCVLFCVLRVKTILNAENAEIYAGFAEKIVRPANLHSSVRSPNRVFQNTLIANSRE